MERHNEAFEKQILKKLFYNTLHETILWLDAAVMKKQKESSEKQSLNKNTITLCANYN